MGDEDTIDVFQQQMGGCVLPREPEGPWLAQSVEHMTLDLRFVGLSPNPMLGVEIS